MKIILKVAVAGLICALLSSCLVIPGKSRCYTKPVAGRVIDSKTGEGIAGAEIEYFPSASYAFPERICYTDSNGFFILEGLGFTATCSLYLLPSSVESPPIPLDIPEYMLKVSADGYDASGSYVGGPVPFGNSPAVILYPPK